MRVGSFRWQAVVIVLMLGSASFAGESAPAEQSATATIATTEDQTDKQSGPVPEVVQVEPIPEPSTGLLLCFAGVAALGRRHRR